MLPRAFLTFFGGYFRLRVNVRVTAPFLATRYMSDSGVNGADAVFRQFGQQDATVVSI